MKTDNVPPSSRYAGASTYAFWLQRLGKDGADLNQDTLISSGDFVTLYLSPQQITMTEPDATAITFTQGGGKFVESRGGLIRHVAISGTTGYMPIPQMSSLDRFAGGLVDESQGAEQSRAERSGFKAFYDLRALFRKFKDLRRDPATSLDTLMHYMDFKGDEFWLIEPQGFVMNRSVRSPFTYAYDIRFACLEPTDVVASSQGFGIPNASGTLSVVQSAFVDTPGADLFSGSPASGIGTTIGRFSDMINNGVNSIDIVSGVLQQSFQGVLTALSSVVGLYETARALPDVLSQIPADLFRQLDAAIGDAFDSMGSNASFEELSTGILAEWNEYLIEARFLNDLLLASSDGSGSSYSAGVAKDVSRLAEARTSGSATDIMPETGTPLSTNPFVGTSGVDPMIDAQSLLSSNGFRSIVVYYGDTIFDVARRALGNVSRYVELILVNDLQSPYIVASGVNKPPGTIAWGEYIKVPIQVDGGGGATGPPSGPVAAFVGKVSAPGTSSQLVDANGDPPWRDNQWVGFTVTLTSGAGLSDPTRVVVANTEDTLSLNRPWTTSPTIGDSFSLVLTEFHLRVQPTDEQLAYGRDILLRWVPKAGSSPDPYKAVAVLNASGDLATISGMENFIQAILLFFATPRREHPFHPSSGAPLPIGRPFSEALLPLYNYFVRQALLADPRVAAVERPILSFDGQALRFQAGVRPVNAHQARQIDVSVPT